MAQAHQQPHPVNFNCWRGHHKRISLSHTALRLPTHHTTPHHTTAIHPLPYISTPHTCVPYRCLNSWTSSKFQSTGGSAWSSCGKNRRSVVQSGCSARSAAAPAPLQSISSQTPRRPAARHSVSPGLETRTISATATPVQRSTSRARGWASQWASQLESG
jgi:hypothetical protein